MFGRALLGAVLIMFIGSAGFAAEGVPGTLASMVKTNAEMKKLKTEANELLVDNENEQKKIALWNEQLETRIPKIYGDFVVRRDKSLAEEERLTNEVNRFNSVCTGEVSQAQYEKCAAEAPVLKKAREKNIAERNDLIQEEKDIYNEEQKYLKAIAESNEKISGNFNRHLEIMDEYAEKKKDLEAQRKTLAKQCDLAEELDDGEALAHCHSVYWDGTNRALPPLNEILRGTRFFGE